MAELKAAEREQLVTFLVLAASDGLRDLVSGVPTVADMEPADVYLKLEGDTLFLQTAGKEDKAPPIGFGANIKG